MNISKLFQKNIKAFFALIFLSVAYIISLQYEKPFITVSKQNSSINFNDNLLEFFHFGFKRMISSTLWISTILESDIEHYQKKDLNSWMYLRFKTISILEPDFYENYAFGGPYLSVIKDDITGASSIFKSGILKFPNDLNLLRDAGFHFYFETDDFDTTYKIYKKIQTLSPKKNLLDEGILARLEADSGNLNLAYQLQLNLLASLSNKSLIREKVIQNLYALKAEIDLECLNYSKKVDCSKIDFEGNEYLYLNGKYYAGQKWTPFRVKKKFKK